jgi:hypothetical protein
VRIRIPEQVTSTPLPTGPHVLICSEPGRGELTIELFAAGLIIDRDGILEQMASEAAWHAVVAPAAGDLRGILPVELAEGPTGFVAEIDLTRDDRGLPPELRFLDIYVVAPSDLAVPGGAVVTVRRASDEWPAAAEMLSTLRLGANSGAANDARANLPVVGHRRGR